MLGEFSSEGRVKWITTNSKCSSKLNISENFFVKIEDCVPQLAVL